ncbi:hypothetical protein HMPREF0063_11719 [Aeromicrobium marinum DSM 15272]|uniref:Uncharacterized protein n=1 Tax=Aeromicrobium marinum DSM 15272 TaxID=585531 RepID=E2SDD3_9ACTN|nr:hypothetical protein [Aeromicrobium marinum]EFQ82510.1 hypothetical protein HMPREF0063_11719 [Aeromicrobium marinum DSM 15272]
MTEVLAAVQDAVWQAHHPLLLAIPAFVPAIVIAGVVVYVARKDRREEREERELLERALDDLPEDLEDP